MNNAKLLVKTVGGTNIIMDGGVFVYLWQSNGPLEAVRESLVSINKARIATLCIHAGTAAIISQLEQALTELRNGTSKLGKLRMHIGIGIDGSMKAWNDNKITTQQITARYIEVSKKIASLRQKFAGTIDIEAVVLNGEAGWKTDLNTSRTPAEHRALATSIGEAFKKYCQDVVLGISTFGALGFHSGVRALLEAITPYCSLYTGQSYAARSGEILRETLNKIVARDEKSTAAAVKQEWMRDDLGVLEDTSHDDLDRVPSFQGYKTHPTTLGEHIVRRILSYMWALPLLSLGGRFDDDGLDAVAMAIYIREHFGRGMDAVKAFQTANSLFPDGVPGAQTRAAVKKLIA